MTIYTTSHAEPEESDEMTEAPERIWAQKEAFSDDWDAGTFCTVSDGGVGYMRADHVDALLKAEREKALREAADMLASDAAHWGDEAEKASTRHLTEIYSGKAVACQECKDVIEALISEGATDGVERKRK